jgi:hypothetical protein
MTPRYQRLRTPKWITKTSSDEWREKLQPITGEEKGWGLGLPWMYRALASPWTHERMLAAPTVNGGDFGGSYWAPLLHFMIYTLGWARPDRGLKWWYDAGKPTDDPHLRFLSDIWGKDGQLDWFAAWLWATDHLPPAATRLSQLTGYQDDGRPVVADRAWVDLQMRLAAASGIQHPGHHGDEFHLSGHFAAPLEEPGGDVSIFHGDVEQRRAVLMLDSMVGWYAALVRYAARLPSPGERSWRVDVVVRPVGLLGTYRLSRTSRLWFACRHRVHLPGT